MAKQKKQSWYTFVDRREPACSSGKHVGFTAIKFDEEGEPKEVYFLNLRGTTCTCPARIPHCRHKSMLNVFHEASKIGSGWLYCHDTKEWQEPSKSIDEIMRITADLGTDTIDVTGDVQITTD